MWKGNVESLPGVPTAWRSMGSRVHSCRIGLRSWSTSLAGQIKFSVDVRVWRTTIPACQRRSEGCLRASAPRFAQHRGAWPVLAPTPPAPRYARVAGAEPRFSSCPFEKIRSATFVRLFGIRRWNLSSVDNRTMGHPGSSLSSQGGRFGGNQIAGWPLPILEVPNEQREAYR